MRISTPVAVALSLDAIDPKQISPVADSDGALRLVDGKPVYPLRNVVVRDADGQTVRASSVKVHTLPTTQVSSLTPLRCVDCLITPWADGRQIALSVIADHVEPMTSAAFMEADDE